MYSFFYVVVILSRGWFFRRRTRCKQLCWLSSSASVKKCLAAIYLPRNDFKVSLSVLMSWS